MLCIDPVHWNMKRARPNLSFRPEQPWGRQHVMPLGRRLREELALLSSRGVRIGKGPAAPHYMLRWGGEVAHSGNCLFEAFAAALGDASASAVSRRPVCWALLPLS